MISRVRAGHGSWERKRHLNAADNTVTSTLEKRYFIFEPKGTYRVWPNSEIKYCFENDETKQKLLYDLEAAVQKWYAAGLIEQDFKFTEVPPAECRDNRAEVLLISYNDRGLLSTTVALPPLDANNPDYHGPTMMLSDQEDVGMLNKISNYAHEMGHAWGLLHEHQNPLFWEYPYSTMGVQNVWTFQCQNLKDHAALAGRLSPQDLQEACTSRNRAAQEKFSAAEYLPQLGGGRGEGGSFGSPPDLTSIMLYPSGAGALGLAAPGNDQRQAILLNQDGSRIPINLNPSTRDVQGILRLYNTNWGTTNPVLLVDKSSSKSAKFKSLFGRKKCL